MANVKWSAFPAGAAIAGVDVPVGLQGGACVQWTFTQLATFAWATPSLTGTVTSAGSMVFSTAAAGPTLKQGANGRVGTFTLNGATPVTVNNTSIAIADAIIISLNTVGGTVGVGPNIRTITAGSGFTVAGTALDTSVYNYAIIKNAA